MKQTYNIEDLPKIAALILQQAPYKTMLFYGDMGVGKTTLIKEILHALGVSDNITSPTYSIVNQYQISDNEVVNHLDCYRIETLEDALNIGLEEYFNTNTYSFIEWPERILPLIPKEHTIINVNQNINGSRTLQLMPMK